MKIHDIVLITPNIVNSNMNYMQTYVIFCYTRILWIIYDPLTKYSTLNNADTHK